VRKRCFDAVSRQCAGLTAGRSLSFNDRAAIGVYKPPGGGGRGGDGEGGGGDGGAAYLGNSKDLTCGYVESPVPFWLLLRDAIRACRDQVVLLGICVIIVALMGRYYHFSVGSIKYQLTHLCRTKSLTRSF